MRSIGQSRVKKILLLTPLFDFIFGWLHVSGVAKFQSICIAQGYVTVNFFKGGLRNKMKMIEKLLCLFIFSVIMNLIFF